MLAKKTTSDLQYADVAYTLASATARAGRKMRGKAYIAPISSLHWTPSMSFNRSVVIDAFNAKSPNTRFFSYTDIRPGHSLLTAMQYNTIHNELESSQSPQTSAKAMLFARWQHHIRFGSDFPYAPLKALKNVKHRWPLKAMLTKISKWSRIQDSFRITPKIEPLVVFAIPDISSKFQKDPSITFWVILLTHRQTDRQTNKVWQNITSLAEVINIEHKHKKQYKVSNALFCLTK